MSAFANCSRSTLTTAPLGSGVTPSDPVPMLRNSGPTNHRKCTPAPNCSPDASKSVLAKRSGSTAFSSRLNAPALTDRPQPTLTARLFRSRARSAGMEAPAVLASAPHVANQCVETALPTAARRRARGRGVNLLAG